MGGGRKEALVSSYLVWEDLGWTVGTAHWRAEH